MKWHDLHEIIGQRSDIEIAKRPEFAYARISIDLGDAQYVGTDIPLAFSGDQLAKIKYTGSTTGAYFRLNDRHAQQIYPSEFKRSSIPFTKIYLTNPAAQTGKTFTFYIGTHGGILPSLDGGSGGDIVGVSDTDGSHINPAREDGQLAAIKTDTGNIRLAVKVEDAAHLTGDYGMPAFAVRQDTLAVLAGDGDYIPLVVDAEGKLYIKNPYDAVDGGGDLQKVKEELEKINNREDPDFPDHTRTITPLLDTDMLSVTTTGASDTIAAPGVGHHLEIFGYAITTQNLTPTGVGSSTYLWFATSGITLYNDDECEDSITTPQSIAISGIRVAGANNEALTLVNKSFTGGSVKTSVTVFYKDITD